MKKIIFSGVQPSGDLTIGNYLGALKNMVKLQDDYNCFYSVVDLHAITVKQNPDILRERSLLTYALYKAVGIDTNKSTLFIQSHVKEHTELSWLLGCGTYMGELSRMIQYKEKSQKHGESIPSGLFNYPVLMAADILLYNSDLVPVGDDQNQHIELTRDLAVRFNNAHGDTFKIPEIYLNKFGSRIYDLQEPTKKMDKSAISTNGVVFLLDSEKDIRRKLSRAVTDAVGKINYNNNQPGVKNLINIFSHFSDINIENSIKHFEGKGYKDLKDDTCEAVLSFILPLQKNVKDILSDKAELEKMIKEGANKARQTASKTVKDVKRKIGLIV